MATKESNRRKGELIAHVRSIQREIVEANSLGSGPQRRNLNKECGYPDEVMLQDIVDLYDREGVAKRVVQVYPVETWKTHPEVYEVDSVEETPFEEANKEFVDQYNIWSLLERADILSGIGHFGVILLGFNDGAKDLRQPMPGFTNKDNFDMPSYKLKSAPKKSYELLYTKCFDQRQVTIMELEKDKTSPRYGRPTIYRISSVSIDEQGQVMQASTDDLYVHWHRIVHLADNLESSDIIGVPRLRTAYNRVHDLLKVIGGSGEMFWKGGFPGLSFEVQPNLQGNGITGADFDVAEFREEVERYANGLQRYLRLVGLNAKSLAPQVADPTPHVDAGLDQVCITINCPKRIFLGTESAHLASTQDQKTWSDRINGRRDNYAIPSIVRPFFTRMIVFGVLPFVKKFKVHWRDPEEVDPLVRAQAFEKLVNGISQYVSSGMATLFPPMEFLTELLGYDNALARTIVDAAEKQAKKKEMAVPLVGATDKMEAEKEAAKMAADSKAQQLKARAGKKPGAGGDKAGTGKRRTVKDVSTGKNGG